MADNSIANDFLSSLGGAIAAQANKPQKTSSTTTSTPLQLADMLARRNTIGNASANLAESLKQREGFGYNLANSMAGLPGAQQEGTGAGLLNFAKAFGGAYNGRTNSAIDNAQKQYDASRTDLSDALNYDKEMGNQQTEDIGYNSTGADANVGLFKNLPLVNKNLPSQLMNSNSLGGKERLLDEQDISPITKSFLRSNISSEKLAERSALLQDVSGYVGLATTLARSSGATAAMMNSDKEGQRNLAILENPGNKTKEELANAIFGVQKMIDRTTMNQFGQSYFGTDPNQRIFGEKNKEEESNTRTPEELDNMLKGL